MSDTDLAHLEIDFTSPEIEREVFVLDGDSSQSPVTYPVGWYERYVELYTEFEEAKQAKNHALAEAKQRLLEAKVAYNEAVANSPEVTAADDAREAITEFRKFVWSHGFSFPHPDKLIPVKE